MGGTVPRPPGVHRVRSGTSPTTPAPGPPACSSRSSTGWPASPRPSCAAPQHSSFEPWASPTPRSENCSSCSTSSRNPSSSTAPRSPPSWRSTPPRWTRPWPTPWPPTAPTQHRKPAGLRRALWRISRLVPRSALNKSHFPMINVTKPQVSCLLLDRKQGYSVAFQGGSTSRLRREHAATPKADIACRRLAELSRSVTRHHRRVWQARCPTGQTRQLSPGFAMPSSAATPSSAPGRPTLLVALVCPW